jgi:thiol-disulfide isomerase/thioredoxin
MKIARGILLALLLFPLTSQASLTDPLKNPFPAPDVTSPGPWLNSKPLTPADLKDKVVLVDFWTYSCINCIRTLPYQRAWYEHYKDQGFVILGIHSPEFDFEKETANVEKALKRFKITWPVVLDNNKLLWDRFSNEYWPAHYLIDRNGQVVFAHFGEGKYDVMEHNIRELLATDPHMPMAKMERGSQGKAAYQQSLETYLGTERAERFTTDPAPVNGVYKFPAELAHDYWALDGAWDRQPQFIESKHAGSSLRLRFRGGKVFLVMSTADGKPVKAKIFYDGKSVGDKAGKDVIENEVTVDEQRLYEIFDRKSKSIFGSDEGIIEIQSLSPGLRAYAFTFGA